MLGDKRCVVVGVARDCENSLEKDLSLIRSALAGARSIKFFIVESDSSDQTVNVLRRLKETWDDFSFKSIGSLRERMSKRTERIAYCRNICVDAVNLDQNLAGSDYVIVADLDGLNTDLSRHGLESCFRRDDWDVCTANQDGPYYDIWALRHPHWSPNDCWQQYHFFSNYMQDQQVNRMVSVFSKMIRIPKGSDWIQVESAFGGLAIYKRDIFCLGRYLGLSETGEEVCEHVHFHQMLNAAGAKIFINPDFVNAGITEHSLPTFFDSGDQMNASSERAVLAETIGALLSHVISWQPDVLELIARASRGESLEEREELLRAAKIILIVAQRYPALTNKILERIVAVS